MITIDLSRTTEINILDPFIQLVYIRNSEEKKIRIVSLIVLIYLQLN